MNIKALYVFIAIVSIFFCEQAVSADPDYWTSLEPLGAEVIDFPLDTEDVYCNWYSSEKPTEPVKWMDPHGNEADPGHGINWVHPYQYPGMYYIWMVVKTIYREPGQWHIEHYGMPVAYFNLPPKPFLSISPISFENLNVVDSFDAPGICPEGLTFDGTYLWLSDWCEEKLYKLDPMTGSVVNSFDTPGSDPHGLAFDGTHLWSVGDYGYPWYEVIYKLDPTTGEVLDFIDSPCYHPAGLAFDGTHLWVTDSVDEMIYKLDPATGEVVHSVDSPFSQPQGLAFDGKYLWLSDVDADDDWKTPDKQKICKLDNSANLIHSFDSPDYEGDLAFDGTYLWAAYWDLYDEKIYKIETPGTLAVGSSKSRTFTISSLGTIDLTIDPLSITGPDASQFRVENDTCSGNAMAQYETCTFDVVFSPTSAGDKSAVLEIRTNDVRTPPQIPLSGTAIVKQPPTPDIKANGSDGPLELSSW